MTVTSFRVRATAVAACLLAGLLPTVLGAQQGSPAGVVPPALLAQRRASLIHGLGNGVAVVVSAEERGENAHAQDTDYREDNDFFYLTGLEAPGGVLVLSARSGEGEATLFLPPRQPAAERWTGPQLGPGPEAAALTGIARVLPLGDLKVTLTELRGVAGDTLWSLLVRARDPACGGAKVVAGRCAPALRALDIEEGNWRDLRPLLTKQRSVKDADELRRLRSAAAITSQAHVAVLGALQPGLWEYELEATIEYVFRAAGAERVGFPSIVGSGPFSTILHYDKNRRRMEAGDLVVVDIGAEYGYYTGDVTRTYPVSGHFTARQRSIYELVLGAQQAAIALVRPGGSLGELQQAAQQYMKANSGSLCGARTCDQYFIHGISHHIGMDVHDAGPSTPLQPGMVITIEPGIYLPDEQLGVRIEDDVLVTPAGHEVISNAPRTVAEIEQGLSGPRSRAHALH